MLILDTNVLSALMQTTPDAAVMCWLDRQAAETLWTTSITVFELQFGIGTLPAGRRRTALQAAFAELISTDLNHRVLPFDTAAAAQAAELAARRQQNGRPVDMRDTQIAGIAQVRRGAVVTRNVRHFEGLSVAVHNPWDAG